MTVAWILKIKFEYYKTYLEGIQLVNKINYLKK